MRRVLFAIVALATVAMIGSIAVGTEAGSDSRPTRYIVLYEPNASPAALQAAVKQADGRILRANGKVGVATVVSSNTRFRAEAARSAVIDGVARNVPISLEPVRRSLTPPSLALPESTAGRIIGLCPAASPARSSLAASPSERRCPRRSNARPPVNLASSSSAAKQASARAGFSPS